ncbi:phospholipase D-like domain-containing protein [uncultured Sphingomonas sp.]|uniref:phospholipase D-like domain-containing protein n=1 Tax=uncultured Sphingomonas sp. TaxID=158754 RepID=UPI0035CA15DE
MSVIIDADDYFRVLRRSMMLARHRIMLVGWDFDARIALDRDERLPGEPRTVGGFVRWLVDRTPGLEVNLLRWDLGAVKSLFRGTTIFSLLRWMTHPRITTLLDGHHPMGASHHQKIVVIDDCLAFCGGIDVTSERWDTSAHLDDEPGRRTTLGRPYKPWHDATSAVQGPLAAALGELARDRWSLAGGERLVPVPLVPDCWPPELAVDFENVEVGIARTAPAMPDCEPIHESEALFLTQIAAVKRHLYVESQYFASRRIAEAIAKRLVEPDGPEFVIVNPRHAQGWLEPIAMDTARARLMTALWARDPHMRLRLYHPVTTGGLDIYVHAKILIADDDVFRLGSSNMNNRSLRLDTECDLALEAPDDAARATIGRIRTRLIAEHLDVAPAEVDRVFAETRSLIQTIERLRGSGKTLDPYEVPDVGAVTRWLADNEVLDPEGPDEMFESLAKRGLFRRRLRPPR